MTLIIPAKAGIRKMFAKWIPAFAGMLGSSDFIFENKKIREIWS